MNGPAPDIEWLPGGTPRSRHFDDIYFNPVDGVAESEAHFVQGVGIPQAWRNRDRFVIGETGFGTGLNFLLTLAAWKAHREPGAVLHYLSCEAYPLESDQLERAHQALPESLRCCAARLREVYPSIRRGFRRVWLEDEGVALTLLFGDAAQTLAEMEATVDAWFLDGFAPQRNRAMWSDAVFGELARLSRTGTRLATFTAAGFVRRGLERAGFEVQRAPGFGPKRERITGIFRGPRPQGRLPAWAACPAPRSAPVEIDGGGIAGSALALALERRHKTSIVRTVERRLDGASSVPRPVVMPRLSADVSLGGRLFSAALPFARRHYEQTGAFVRAEVCEHVSHSDTARAAAMAARWDEVAFDDRALLYQGTGWVKTPALSINATADHRDAARPIRVLASGPGLQHPALPLSLWRGQVTLFSSKASAPPGIVAGRGYLLGPDERGLWQVGATFDRVTSVDAALRDNDDQRNLQRLESLWPLAAVDASPQGAWAGVRVATPDRLPVAGPLPDVESLKTAFAAARSPGAMVYYPGEETVWALGGLGARGYTLAPLAAELLVSQMYGDPWPIERDIALTLHPARFAWRSLKRGQPIG